MLANKSKKELCQLAKKLVPPLLPSFHKGQAGRVAVIGGCEDFTGAPFFSSHAAALTGCDMSHVICERSAGQIIKTYSPDLMVHPYLADSQGLPKGCEPSQYIEDQVMPKVLSILSRIHAVVVGPGFGRDETMLLTLEKIILEVKNRKIPLIMDADSLFLVSRNPDIIKGYSSAILTPNVVEFKRLADALHIQYEIGQNNNTVAKEMSEKLGGVIIVQKGQNDVIAGPSQVIVDDEPGSNRRVGGQGDSLTGVMLTFLAWGQVYKEGLWDEAKKAELDDESIKMLSAFAASVIARRSSKRAFEEYGRHMQTSDLHKFIGESFESL